MTDKRRYKRYGLVPFKKPVGHTKYQQVRRSKNPVQKADELKILDKKKLKNLMDLFVFEVALVMVYFIRILV